MEGRAPSGAVDAFVATLGKCTTCVLHGTAVSHAYEQLHHEALDGSGYPDGLKGDQIPPLTRILTVCDVFAAIVETRSYKSAQPTTSAIMTLVDMALRSRVDYEAVRRLASAFSIPLPQTLEELAASLAQPTRAQAS